MTEFISINMFQITLLGNITITNEQNVTCNISFQNTIAHFNDWCSGASLNDNCKVNNFYNVVITMMMISQ